MAQLDQATKRLQTALDSLERAVESRSGSGSGSGGGDGGEADLRAALDLARQENAALQDAAGAVATRLDKTIERLKATLEA
jgi:hypothetical protein